MGHVRTIPSIAIAILLCILPASRGTAQQVAAQAEPEPRVLVAAGVGLGLTSFSGGTIELDSDAPVCGLFSDGDGTAIGPIVGTEVRITASTSILVAGSMSFETETLSFPCIDPASVRMPDGSITDVRTDFVRDHNRVRYEAGVGIGFRPMRSLRIDLLGSAVDRTEGSLIAEERVLEPVGARFESGGDVRSIEIDPVESTIRPSISVGLTGLLVAGETTFLLPTIDASYTPAGRQLPQEVSLSVGLSIGFTFGTLPIDRSTPLDPADE